MLKGKQVQDQIASQKIPTVLHVVNTLSGGGTERHLLSLLQHFDHRRMRHVVATLRDVGDLADRLPNQVACRPLFASHRERGTGFRLASVARKCDVDLIHARNTGVWLDATVARFMFPRSRLLLGFHGLDSSPAFCNRVRLKCRLGAWVGANFASVSWAGRDQLMQQGRAPSDRTHVLANGVDLERFRFDREKSRATIRTELGLKSADFVVGAVGSMTLVKRFDVLLHALAKLRNSNPPLKAVLVGDGPLMNELRTLANNLEVSDCVRFCGWREDVPRLMTAFDILACTSDSEGMSNAILEGMASGLPIVATDVADHARLLADGKCGLVFTKGSPTELAGKLMSMANSREERERLSAAARAFSMNFDIRQVVRNYEQLYESLIFLEDCQFPIREHNYRPVTRDLVPVTTS